MSGAIQCSRFGLIRVNANAPGALLKHASGHIIGPSPSTETPLSRVVPDCTVNADNKVLYTALFNLSMVNG